MSETPEELPAIDTDAPEADHPDEVTKEEADKGQALYEAVDDLDDDAEWSDQ